MSCESRVAEINLLRLEFVKTTLFEVAKEVKRLRALVEGRRRTDIRADLGDMQSEPVRVTIVAHRLQRDVLFQFIEQKFARRIEKHVLALVILMENKAGQKLLILFIKTGLAPGMSTHAQLLGIIQNRLLPCAE